jgi:signal peptidase II
MRVLILMLVAVPLADLASKSLLRRVLGSRAAVLGPLGSLQLVPARIWLAHLPGRSNPAALWTLWALAAGALALASAGIPSSRPFVGLLLGGSLSNALESSLRGRVTDYICLRFWPAFNLADVALAAGAIGVLAELLIAAALAFRLGS